MTIRYKLIPDIEHGDGSKTVFKAVRRAVDNWNGEIHVFRFVIQILIILNIKPG